VIESESLYAGDPLPRPYVLKPVNEGSSVGVAIVTADGNIGNPIARDAAGPWQEFETLLAEPYHPRARADDSGAGRQGAAGDRAAAQIRLL
jgi:hypothetical protein